MEFQVHTTTAKRRPVLLTFPFIGLSGLLFQKRWRRRDKGMEPQGRGNVPARHTPERDKRLGLRKTTLESRVHVQTVGLNAETKKVSAPSRRGDISLDILFYRTSTRCNTFPVL